MTRGAVGRGRPDKPRPSPGSAWPFVRWGWAMCLVVVTAVTSPTPSASDVFTSSPQARPAKQQSWHRLPARTHQAPDVTALPMAKVPAPGGCASVRIPVERRRPFLPFIKGAACPLKALPLLGHCRDRLGAGRPGPGLSSHVPSGRGTGSCSRSCTDALLRAISDPPGRGLVSSVPSRRKGAERNQIFDFSRRQPPFGNFFSFLTLVSLVLYKADYLLFPRNDLEI